ncbi:DciA family protein [uncultured Corynebacterium sp.]|uniref:DciA family protein n=1 Tax=uncultured Corynebacterium sp. TaxID=159447 RepID=UPI0025D64ED5|nr:DciA family protein [uncultured Corynebacterium sp.]
MSDDFIARAVAAARAQSKHPPRLNKPVAKMPSLDERANARKLRELGRATGPDGRARRRGLGIPSLGDVLRDTIQSQGWEAELGHGWIFGHWPEIVGDAIAAHTAPEKVENQVLYVSCDHSNWATNLRYLQGEILKKIAAKVGDDVILALRIQGPKQHRNYEGPQWVKPQGSQDTYG